MLIIVCECEHVCVIACLWRSEEWVSHFLTEDPRNLTQVTRLVWETLLTLSHLSSLDFLRSGLTR